MRRRWNELVVEQQQNETVRHDQTCRNVSFYTFDWTLVESIRSNVVLHFWTRLNHDSCWPKFDRCLSNSRWCSLNVHLGRQEESLFEFQHFQRRRITISCNLCALEYHPGYFDNRRCLCIETALIDQDFVSQRSIQVDVFRKFPILCRFRDQLQSRDWLVSHLINYQN